MSHVIVPIKGIKTFSDESSRLLYSPSRDGEVVVQLDNNTIYIYDQPTGDWVAAGSGALFD